MRVLFIYAVFRQAIAYNGDFLRRTDRLALCGASLQASQKKGALKFHGKKYIQNGGNLYFQRFPPFPYDCTPRYTETTFLRLSDVSARVTARCVSVRIVRSLILICRLQKEDYMKTFQKQKHGAASKDTVPHHVFIHKPSYAA